jgi:hypothetical protein
MRGVGSLVCYDRINVSFAGGARRVDEPLGDIMPDRRGSPQGANDWPDVLCRRQQEEDENKRRLSSREAVSVTFPQQSTISRASPSF